MNCDFCNKNIDSDYSYVHCDFFGATFCSMDCAYRYADKKTPLVELVTFCKEKEEGADGE